MKRTKLNGNGRRAAIYLRKSTDDADRDEELRSTAMQESNARKFAAAHGLTVASTYKDEATSGAQISRPGLDAMLADLGIVAGKRERRAPDPASRPFDVLIVRDQSRLVRNPYHALRLLKQIISSGVAIACYKTGEIHDAENFNELLVGVRGHVDADKREQSRIDVREGLAERALKGYNAGGCCYGYTNKPIWGDTASGSAKRLYTDFAINMREAAVVKRIFAMYAAGFGPRVIAKTLNADPRYRDESRKFFNGQRPPKPVVGKRGTGSWAPSAVRDMLRNERYAGVLVFGRMRTEYDEDGVEYRIRQPERSKIIRTERPDLRIIPPDLWEAAQKRIKGMHDAYRRSEAKDGRLTFGKPETGRHSRYLLSGIFQCPECGASLIAHRMSVGSGRTRRLAAFYVCSANNKRGPTICPNNARVPQAELDGKLMDYVERHVLSPDRAQRALKQAVEDARQRVRKDPGLRAKLEAQIARLTREKANLTALSAQRLDDPEAVAEQINERHREIERLKLELQGLPDEQFDVAKLAQVNARMLERLSRFGEMVRDKRNIPALRQVLKHALRIHDLRLTPKVENGRKTYGISGKAWISTTPIRRETVASPRGFEPRLPP